MAMPMHGQSALDGFNPNVDGNVYAVVVQPDGKTLIGGTFTSISPPNGTRVVRNRIARLNSDGSVDAAFDPNVDGSVRTIALQADGRVLVGGSFTAVGGQGRNRIARLDPATGSVDSFDPNAAGTDAEVFSIAVQPDGKILAGGTFTSIGGQLRNYVARLNEVSGLADSFDPSPNGGVQTIALQKDGKILLGGDFTTVGGQVRNRVARLDQATGLVDSFDPGANSSVRAIALQADGRILLGGHFTSLGSVARNRIARVNPVTGLPDSFDPGANNDVTTIAIQSDGKIVVGGLFTDIGGRRRSRIARLDANTGLVESFAANSNGPVFAVAVQSDGRVIAGGAFTETAGESRNGITRLELDGRLDRTLNPALTSLGTQNRNSQWAQSNTIQPDGKILICGSFTSVQGVPRNSIARLNTDGSLDLDFNPNPDSRVRAVAVQADGKILVGGYFTNIGGQPRKYIARLDPITGLADSFDPSSDSYVQTLAVQPDGKILAGGNFGSIGGQTRSRIARLDPSTGLADSFNPSAQSAAGFFQVHALALQADGKILVAGYFNYIGGQNRVGFARLDPATGLADSFDPRPLGSVYQVTVQADGKLLICGTFGSVGPVTWVPRTKVARLDPTTGVPDSFNPTLGPSNAEVYSVAAQADGEILIGGTFTTVNGLTRNKIARLDGATGEPDSFNANLTATDFVGGISVQSDGKLLVGGTFNFISGQPRTFLARLASDRAALQTLSATPNSITWTRSGAGPQLSRVAFGFSTDGVNYVPLGYATSTGGTWTLGGLDLPVGQNVFVRGQGYYLDGKFGGSENTTETVQNVFLVGPTE